MNDRTQYLALTAVVLLVAGCGGAGDTPLRGDDPTTPAVPTDATATDRALAAEGEYVSARLANASCLTYWELGEFTASATATVTNRTQDGVVVAVQRPYSWGTNQTVADGVSNARYLVTDTETIRRSGPSIAPC
jgi:hypothetical protein